MKKILTISAILSILLTGCYNEPKAMFDYYPSQPEAGESVSFENLSVDAVSFEWSFGDGSISTQSSPSHIYESGGVYNVQLKAMGKKGELDVMNATVTVISLIPVADFSYTPLDPIAGQSVYFNNNSSNAATVLWDFGDGITSIVMNPEHTFANAGTYTVTLTATGPDGDTDAAAADIVVGSDELIADFWVSTDLPGDPDPIAVETDVVFTGELISLNNISSSASSVIWDFGDGYTSTALSPQLSYDTPGTYTISLTAMHGGETDVYSKTIEVYEGVNSCVRITVLEYYDSYSVEGASILLYPSLTDWENETNASEEVFTTALGKCVFEGLNEQVYYVDVWEANHDNIQLAAEDVGFIETQYLEAGYIHDFVAYVDYYEDGKKHVKIDKVAQKKLAKETVSTKKNIRSSELKNIKFSKAK